MNTNIHQLNPCRHETKQFRGKNKWFCTNCDTYGEYKKQPAGPLDAIVENPDFSDVWRIWPLDRRGAKPGCIVLYDKTVQPGGFDSNAKVGESMMMTHKEGTPQQIFQGSQIYLKSKGGKFIQLLTTFLNQGGWMGMDDE